MLKSHTHLFSDAVWSASGRIGSMNAPRVTDDIIGALFPSTVSASNHEGAFSMFRNGVLVAVRKVLSQRVEDEGQTSLFDIPEPLRQLASALKRGAYYVEHLDEFVPLPRLIKELQLLDDARKYMRKKEAEVRAEANALDSLYRAAKQAANDNAAAAVSAAA